MHRGLTDIQHDVARFMLAAGQVIREHPQNIPDDERHLRIRLITEEFDETIDALLKLGNPALNKYAQSALIADVADGVVDLMYVLIGTTLAMGINLDPVWEAVQYANMTKMSGPVREDGKRLKPDDWQPPDVLGIIREQQQEGRFLQPIVPATLNCP
jgi:predicted HAD superfamily Cof-like phosphohydrolase